MALGRCEICGCPQGMKLPYPHVHKPLSDANDRLICGMPTCVRPAHIWLTDEEEQEYLRGRRGFSLPGHPQVQVM